MNEGERGVRGGQATVMALLFVILLCRRHGEQKWCTYLRESTRTRAPKNWSTDWADEAA
jgi:hypothetical protein